jgi:hypothetical protein
MYASLGRLRFRGAPMMLTLNLTMKKIGALR